MSPGRPSTAGRAPAAAQRRGGVPGVAAESSTIARLQAGATEVLQKVCLAMKGCSETVLPFCDDADQHVHRSNSPPKQPSSNNGKIRNRIAELPELKPNIDT